jgi:hypothetical protein
VLVLGRVVGLVDVGRDDASQLDHN